MAEARRRVVLLADRITNSDQAGMIRSFADRLAEHGFLARVLCATWGDVPRDGLRVDEYPGLADRWRSPWTVRALVADEPASRPALLHVLQGRMAPAGLELAERWGVPYLQGVEEFLEPGARLRLSRRWCRGIVAATRELADDLIRQCGVPASRISVIQRGLPIPAPRPQAARVSGGIASPGGSVAVIGAAGPLVHGSGFTTFLNAARRVLDAGIDAEFVVVGQGEEEGELRRRADRLRIVERLTFAGDAAVRLSFWDVLDLYCQPSNVATVGRNLARAMTHGLPAIASDIMGLRALIVHGQTGFRVPPGDSHALARSILDVLADREFARRLGHQGRDSVLRDYDLGGEASSLAGLYRAILDDESPAATLPIASGRG